MQVTKNITLDLLETGVKVIVKAKQNDRNTRYIAAHLYAGNVTYPVPSGTEIAFRYKKPDGTAGFYDALPDNSPAITVSGNTVTVELVEQVLTVAGRVHCEINMYNAASEKLTTFTFEIAVEESVLTDAEIVSSDYYNVLTAEIAKALQAVTDATEQAENAAQSAQEAADSAAMSKDWAAGQPVTYSGAPVSIAYAGENRIASITAYGETPQGGTTEAPVALTGVDSAILFGQHAPVNLAKPEALEVKGVSVIPNADGSVTVKGTATDETWPRLVEVNIPSAIIAGDITISLSSPASVKMQFQAMTPDGRKESYGLSAGSTSITVKIKSGYTGMHIFLSLLPDQTIDETFHIMIAQGTEPVPFVPYVDPSITHLPISRPLHKVGDVRDVCRTRVKSVYDKRIVLDGAEDWKIFSQKPNSFRIPASGRVVKGLSDSYPTLESSEIGSQNGVYLNYTMDIIVTDLACSTVEEFKAHLSTHPLTVYYQSTAYDGTNGLDVCLTEYQTGFVELDGTENWSWNTSTAWAYIGYFLPNNKTGVAPVCSHYQGTGAVIPAANQVAINELGSLIIKDPSWKSVDDAKAYLAAQKEAGTPVQVAYQLAAPETYATDPVDFDNTAGPLTVMTGGEVEVRMTELVGSRSNVSNNTVAFSEAAQDADISSGEKLTVLFGKIKKRFAVIASNLSNIYNKTESDERYATAAQGEKADDALPKTGGTISGNLTVVQDLTVQRAFNGMRIKAGTKIVTTANTTNRAELFTSDQLNTLFDTSGVTYNATNSVVVVANGDYETQSKNITAGFVNSKWAIFSADGSNLLTGGLRVNYIAIKFA